MTDRDRDALTATGAISPPEPVPHVHISGDNGMPHIGAWHWDDDDGEWVCDDPDFVPCCDSVAIWGPGRCTCWVEEFDLEQSDPRLDVVQGCAPAPCHDCAYRPDSPERLGEHTVNGDAAMLERLVVNGHPFTCHQGIRRTARWVHPSGAVYVPPNAAAAFRPPVVNGIAYRADGTPANLCAGWVARRLAWMQRDDAPAAVLDDEFEAVRALGEQLGDAR